MTNRFTIALALLLVAVGCSRQSGRTRNTNQRQRLPSPSGKFVLTVPIETGWKFSEPGVWKVTIRDTQGNLLYKDDEADFVGSLNVYWVWDDADRVWLYNSDDSNIYLWELEGGTWRKTEWGYGHTRKIDREIAPPGSLYPDYDK